jgi:hypothetical protein
VPAVHFYRKGGAGLRGSGADRWFFFFIFSVAPPKNVGKIMKNLSKPTSGSGFLFLFITFVENVGKKKTEIMGIGCIWDRNDQLDVLFGFVNGL